MMANVFCTERFEQYVYGRPVIMEIDHKPLESILKKSLPSVPKRLQRMMMKKFDLDVLQKFDLDVVYKRGKEMYLADTLSPAFTPASAQEVCH